MEKWLFTSNVRVMLFPTLWKEPQFGTITKHIEGEKLMKETKKSWI